MSFLVHSLLKRVRCKHDESIVIWLIVWAWFCVVRVRITGFPEGKQFPDVAFDNTNGAYSCKVPLPLDCEAVYVALLSPLRHLHEFPIGHAFFQFAAISTPPHFSLVISIYVFRVCQEGVKTENGKRRIDGSGKNCAQNCALVYWLPQNGIRHIPRAPVTILGHPYGTTTH